jgi:archaellum component FlaC
MTENVENLVLEHLRALRNELREFRTRHDEDMSDIKQRLTTLERGIGGMKRDAAELYEDHARQQASIDRLAERIDRIERRLELRE